jgi:hypothetical protein
MNDWDALDGKPATDKPGMEVQNFGADSEENIFDLKYNGVLFTLEDSESGQDVEVSIAQGDLELVGRVVMKDVPVYGTNDY